MRQGGIGIQIYNIVVIAKQSCVEAVGGCATTKVQARNDQ